MSKHTQKCTFLKAHRKNTAASAKQQSFRQLVGVCRSRMTHPSHPAVPRPLPPFKQLGQVSWLTQRDPACGTGCGADGSVCRIPLLRPVLPLNSKYHCGTEPAEQVLLPHPRKRRGGQTPLGAQCDSYEVVLYPQVIKPEHLSREGPWSHREEHGSEVRPLEFGS